MLSRRLQQIGVVEAAQGRALQMQLRPGQRLVSRNGDLWRWDGYSIQAGTASAAGARLIERSRLAALETESAKAQGRAAETDAELAAAIAKAEAAGLKTKALRQEAKEAHAELDRTRDQIAAAEHEAQASQQGTRRSGRGADPHPRRARRGKATCEAESRRRCSRSLPCPRWKPHSKRHKPRPPRAARPRHAPTPRSKVSSARCGCARSAWRRSARKRGCGGSVSPMRASRSSRFARARKRPAQTSPRWKISRPRSSSGA